MQNSQVRLDASGAFDESNSVLVLLRSIAFVSLLGSILICALISFFVAQFLRSSSLFVILFDLIGARCIFIGISCFSSLFESSSPLACFCRLTRRSMWDKVFRNGPSKIFSRQPYTFKVFKGCLPQILLGIIFLAKLIYFSLLFYIVWSIEASYPFKPSNWKITFTAITSFRVAYDNVLVNIQSSYCIFISIFTLHKLDLN